MQHYDKKEDEKVDEKETVLAKFALALFFAITVLVCAFQGAVIFSYLRTATDEMGAPLDGWAAVTTMDPNSWGDTLAGILSSIAVLAAVLSVFLQKIELRRQRSEMNRQREQFEKQAKEAAEQTKIMDLAYKRDTEERLWRSVLEDIQMFRDLVPVGVSATSAQNPKGVVQSVLASGESDSTKKYELGTVPQDSTKEKKQSGGDFKIEYGSFYTDQSKTGVRFSYAPKHEDPTEMGTVEFMSRASDGLSHCIRRIEGMGLEGLKCPGHSHLRQKVLGMLAIVRSCEERSSDLSTHHQEILALMKLAVWTNVLSRLDTILEALSKSSSSTDGQTTVEQ